MGIWLVIFSPQHLMVYRHVSIKLVENEGISCEKAISSKNNMCGKTISGYIYIYIIEQQQPIWSGKSLFHVWDTGTSADCNIQYYHRCHFWPTWIQKLRVWCHSVRFLKPEMTSSWVTKYGYENASLSCKWQSKPCTPSECHASWFPQMNPDEAARNFHWSGTQLLGKT